MPALQKLLGGDAGVVTRIIQHFIHNEAFSALEDLLMLVVLYSQAGTDLDTTTKPTSPQLLAGSSGVREGDFYVPELGTVKTLGGTWCA